MTEPIGKKSKYPLMRIEARRIDDGSSRPAYALDELLAPREPPPPPPIVTTEGRKRNIDQVVQTEESSSSGSVKAKKKLKVSVQQPLQETKTIQIEVNNGDNVEEPKKEQETGEPNLPQEGKRNTDQVVQTEQSSTSGPVKPQKKLKVSVQQTLQETNTIKIEVNNGDNVEEPKKEDSNLPREGYSSMNIELTLIEPFKLDMVSDGNTIKITISQA